MIGPIPPIPACMNGNSIPIRSDSGVESIAGGPDYPASRPSSARSSSRSRNFWILVADIGHSVDEADVARHLEAARSCPGSSRSAPPRSRRRRRRARRTPPGTSSYAASGTPTTCAILTAGCVARYASISIAATFSPPTLSMSLSRPRKVRRPVLVDAAEVAGVEPAAAHRLGRLLGILVVAARRGRAPRTRDLAALADRQLVARLGVDDPDLDPTEREAAGRHPLLDGSSGRAPGDAAARLGHAEERHDRRRRELRLHEPRSGPRAARCR